MSSLIIPLEDIVFELQEECLIIDIGPSGFIDQYGHLNYKAIPTLSEPFQDTFMEAHVMMSFDKISDCYGLRSFVKHISVDYNGEIKAGDTITVRTWISKVGNTSIVYQQAWDKGEKNVAMYEMVVVLVDGNGVPTRVPDGLREAIEQAQ